LLNGTEAATFQNDYATYKGNPAPFKDVNAVSNTNWQDYIFRSGAPITDHNLSVSRATKDGNYFLSLNFFNQAGTMYKSNFERYQIRFNVDQNINKFFKIGATLTASISRRANPVLSGLDLLPTAPVYNDDGSYYSINQVSGNTYDNPVAQRDLKKNTTRTWRGLGNVYAQFTILKGLVFKTSFGFDAINTKQNVYNSLKLPSRVFNKSGGYAYVGTTFPITYQNENTLSYYRTFGDHFISAVAGYTWQKYLGEDFSGSASGFSNDVTQYNAIETGTPTTRSIDTDESAWGLKSYLFRVNYTYKDRYMFTVSGREDGSSRLAKGNKWAFFPSVALAWRASEEEFIKKLNVFSNLKLRASYGTSGSQSISPYSVIEKLASGSNVVGNAEVITFSPASSANKNLKWEKTKQLDLGIEAGFFGGRLNVELDYYHKKTTDLLLSRELPYQTGFTSILENVGSLKNDGIELTLNSVNVKTKDFLWTTNLSISKNKNKVLNLGGKDFIENGIATRLIVGQPVGSFWGVKYLGTYKADEIAGTKHQAGDPKLADLDNNGITNINDAEIIGNAEPKFFGGLGTDLTYKNWTLSMFFDFSYGNKIYDLSGRSMETGLNTNVYGRNRDRWTESNPNGWLPRAGSAQSWLFETYAGGEVTGGCDLYLHNGSYLRLKNVNLQYDVPLRNRSIIKSLQFYGTVTNLFTLTSYFGYTPDVSVYSDAVHRGFDQNAYPQSRTYLIGLKVQF
jgi:TonB-linked SusC/RagA family outer membrane protein